MRIVAVADTHLFHVDLGVSAGDVFVHAGDLCRGGELDELREAVAWIRRRLRTDVELVCFYTLSFRQAGQMDQDCARLSTSRAVH